MPFITNSEGNRSPEAYNEVINQFNVESNGRYTPYKRKIGDTYCNIFAWDVTLAMGAEIPQRINIKTKKPQHFPDVNGTDELNANEMASWLADYGDDYGWEEVSASEAQAAANLGQPTVAVWDSKSGSPGHIAVVRPYDADETLKHGASKYDVL